MFLWEMDSERENTFALVDFAAEERRAFAVFVALSLLWLVAYLPHWFTWHWLISDISQLFALLGVPGALMWLIGAASFRSLRMLAAGSAIAMLCWLSFSGLAEDVKAHTTLAIHEARFDKTLEAIRSKPDQKHDSVTVDTSGGRFCVAFDLGSGFLDDFKSIVYDPAGALNLSRQGPAPAPELPFDGYYSRVLHLRGPWYFVYLYPDVPQ